MVIARLLVIRKSPYGEWKYIRYTHRTHLADGRLKRKYCYYSLQKHPEALVSLES